MLLVSVPHKNDLRFCEVFEGASSSGSPLVTDIKMLLIV
jgi:hypothetical protein